MSKVVAKVIRAVPNARISLRARTMMKFSLSVLALCVVCSSCTSPRNTLGSSVSPCFRALGVAEQAIKHRGHFDGVQEVSRDALRRALSRNRPKAILLPPDVANKMSPLCVVLYKGRFSASRVEYPWPPGVLVGRFAIIAVSLQKDRVQATILVERVPLHFGHLFAVLH